MSLAYCGSTPNLCRCLAGPEKPPAIPFGDLSYGAFLFHFPIEQLVAHLFPMARTWWAISLISLPLTAACALFSWTYIEKPILSHKRAILSGFDAFVKSINPKRTGAVKGVAAANPTKPD